MDRTEEHPDNSRNAPGFVAAVCVRDQPNEPLAVAAHRRASEDLVELEP